MAAVMVSIDRAGRVVVSKDLRDRLGIEPGDEFEITADDVGLRLVPVRARRQVVLADDGLPVLERIDGLAVTDADVQRWRDADQR